MTDAQLSHLDERGAMRMVSVHQKPLTDRRAVAEGSIIVPAAVMAAVRDGSTPKGDVFAAARVAGISAAKKTSELIPLCHAIPLSHVEVGFEVLSDRIRVVVSASATSSTGVEMEALTAVAAAALTLYDMLKALSREMIIGDVRLVEKAGGKSDHPRLGLANAVAATPDTPATCDGASSGGQSGLPIRAAVLTVSDRCSAGTAMDTAGPAVAEMLANRLGVAIEWRGILPDDADQIARKLKELATQGIHLIVTVGGTGCAPRDVTPEATRSVILREVPGLSETMRALSRYHTPHAVLQRGLCGIRGSSLIINLPGSEQAATQNLEVTLPGLRHAIELIRATETEPALGDQL